MDAQASTDQPRRKRRVNPIPPEQRDAADVNTTAALLNVSRRTIYSLMSSGELASIKIRGKRVIPRRSRENFIERRLKEVEC